jgi:hypothetical protein
MQHQAVTPWTTVRDLVTPITLRDVYTGMQEQGVPEGTALGLLVLFGANVQIYGDQEQTVAGKE